MANVTTGYGLQLYGTKNGKQPRIRPYYIPSSYATALYVGSPVVKTGTSNTASAFGFKIGQLPEINHAGTTGAITGVITSFGIIPSSWDASPSYNTASTERVAMVCDDPEAIFEVRVNGSLAATDIGLNANISAASGGSTVTGNSTVELDLSSKATTSTLQLKILRLSDSYSVLDTNDAAADGAQVYTVINNHTEANSTAGI